MAKKAKQTKSTQPAALSSNCELTKSPAKRAAAIKPTTAIQDNFPRGLSQPALRALANAGFRHLDQLRHVPTAELRKLHGRGPKALGILQAALKIANRNCDD